MSLASIRDRLISKMIGEWEENDRKILSAQTLPEHIIEKTNIPYLDDEHRGHLLDVYYPDNMQGPFPVIIDIHGGGFFYGYKENNKLFDFHLAKNGFIVFNLNYRLAFNDAKVPDQIQDIISALNWIEKNLERYPADKNKIYLIGESAGAYLAVMAMLISKSERMQNIFNIGKSNLNIKAMGLISSFMDWTRNEFKYGLMRSMILAKAYRKKEYYQNMILKNIPEINTLPPLFITSNADDELDFMTHSFVDILKERKADYHFHYLEKNETRTLGHVFNILHFDWEESSTLNNAMLEYLIRYS
ncbi:MAG: alpha/beta hydrolase [Treponema sp.]|nr:alpha/beta hydrolase [Treponema sp.]